MFDEPGIFTGETGDTPAGGDSLLDGIAALINALGNAASGVIGALQGGGSSGVITVQQPPTSTGFGGSFDLLTVALIAAAVYVIAKR